MFAVVAIFKQRRGRVSYYFRHNYLYSYTYIIINKSLCRNTQVSLFIEGPLFKEEKPLQKKQVIRTGPGGNSIYFSLKIQVHTYINCSFMLCPLLISSISFLCCIFSGRHVQTEIDKRARTCRETVVMLINSPSVPSV